MRSPRSASATLRCRPPRSAFGAQSVGRASSGCRPFGPVTASRRGPGNCRYPLSCLQLFGAQDLHAGRCCENLAELVHPVMCVFGCTDAPIAKLIELIEVRELDFELQGGTA